MRLVSKIFAVMLILSGCTVKPGFNQLEFLKRVSMFQTKAELESQLWTAKIGNFEQLAIPVAHENQLTFYLKDGTEIDFVGWDVTSLRNWNRYGQSVSLRRIDNVLQHTMIDKTTLEVECTEYREISEGFLREGTVRSAECQQSGGLMWAYKNVVVMNDSGEAIWMLHHLAPDMPPLEMRLNLPQNSDVNSNDALQLHTP